LTRNNAGLVDKHQ